MIIPSCRAITRASAQPILSAGSATSKEMVVHSAMPDPRRATPKARYHAETFSALLPPGIYAQTSVYLGIRGTDLTMKRASYADTRIHSHPHWDGTAGPFDDPQSRWQPASHGGLGRP